MARGGKGNRGGSRHIGGYMGRNMPNTLGGDLNDYTSWNTVSHGISGAKKLINQWGISAGQISNKVEKHNAATRDDEYTRFAGALQKMMNTLPGKLGRDMSDYVKTTLKSIEQKGGSNISGEKLAPILQALSSKLDSFSKQKDTTVLEAKMLSDFSKQVGAMVSGATQKGFRGLGSGSRDAIKSAYAFESNKNIDTGLNSLAKAIDDTAKALSDKGLQQDVLNLKAQMRAAADAAKTGAEKFAVLSDSATKLEVLRNTKASGKDRDLIDGIVQGTRKSAEEIDKKNILAGKEVSKGEMKNRWTGIWRAIGTAGSIGSDLKRIVDSGNAVFQAVNSRVNAFARMQMGISSERGSYGRIMRGAGLNFDGMMAAIGAGRGAGMEDSQVVNQMAGLGVNLARARWGEGPLIDNLGKWGLTPYDANGRMKSSEQVMIDMSRKLRSMTDKTEKLQFLAMQGFNPEQMEYVANFEKNYDRMQYLKRNPGARGVLERADILDESGMNARIDAATRIELKRRQILNQNAIDEGIGSGLIRSLHPENWFFNDWTARQKGVEVAKSDKAMENLTRELRNVRTQLKESGGEVSKVTSSIEGLADNSIGGLSLSGGWAEADLSNRGNDSVVHELRKLYGKQFGFESLDATENRNKKYNAGIGFAGGAVGGGLLALILGGMMSGGAAGVVGGPIGIAIGALLGAGAGAFAMFNNPLLDVAKDGSEKEIEKLREMGRRKDREEINRYLSENNMFGIDADTIMSNDFMNDDKKARQIHQSSVVRGLLMEAQALNPDKELDPEKALNYNQDKFFKANQRAAAARGEEVSRQETVEAMARHGMGDNSQGMDERTAWNYIRYGFDKNSSENRAKILMEKRRMLRENPTEYQNKSEEELEEIAANNVEQEWLSDIGKDIYDQAVHYNPEEERQHAVKRFQKAKDYIKRSGLRKESVERLKQKDTRFRQNYANLDHIELGVLEDAIAYYDKIKSGEMSAEDFIEQEKIGGTIEDKFRKNGELPFRIQSDEERRKTIQEKFIRKSQKEIENQVEADLDIGNANEKAWQSARDFYEGDPTYDNLRQEEKNKKLKAKHDEFLQNKRQELIEKYNQEEKGKIDLTGKTAEQKLFYLSIEGKAHGITRNDIANAQMSDEEVDLVEQKFEKGETLSEDEQERYEMWKLGSKAKARERKREKERKKAAEAEERKKAATAVDDDIARIFGDSQDTKSTPTSQSKKKNISNHDIAVMRKAQALGYDLTRGFSKEQIDKFEQAERAREKHFVSLGQGSAADYQEFRNLENQELRGEELSAQQKEYLAKTRKKLSSAQRQDYTVKPFEEEYTPTEAEAAAIAESDKRSQQLSEAQEAAKGKRSLNQMAVFRGINELRTRGMNDKDIFKRFGRANYQAYQEAVASGEVVDSSKKGNFNPANLEEIDKEPGFLVGEANKEAKEEQAAAAMEQVSSAAEKAAASGNEARGGDTNIQTTTTTNVGEVRVEQFFNGITPNDPQAVGEATRTGAEAGIGRLASVVKEDVGNRSSTT